MRPFSARALSAGYEEGETVLEMANLELGEGEAVALVGASGSGKTTLLLASTGVLTNLLEGWAKGEVRISGLDPLGEDYRLLPSKVGIVLQDPDRQISMPYVIDEVSFTLRNLGLEESRAWWALLRFGLSEKAYSETETLSGGEKRRLTLAASLVHDPDLLIMDEPSASIDPWGVREIRSYIEAEKAKGKGVLLIEHKLGFFKGAVDRVYLLSEGITREIGKSESSLLEENGVDVSLREKFIPSHATGELLHRFRDIEVELDGFRLEVDELEIRRGERIALIGPNGGGKTTLLKALAGFYGGRGCRCFYSPQNPDYTFLFSSVREELDEASRKGGGEPLPLNFKDSELSRSPYQLSHGQRRWLSISLSVAYRPDILLLDEPTSGLDLFRLRELLSLLDRLSSAGMGVVASSHDPRFVSAVADRVLFVNRGRVEEISREEGVSMMLEAMGVGE